MQTEQGIIAVDKIISEALVKENITEKYLSQMEAEFLAKSLELSDKDGYKLIVEDHIKLKKFRALIIDVCEKGREDAIETQRKWVAKQKELLARFDKIVGHVAKLRSSFEEEEKRKKEEKRRRGEENLFNRQLALTKMGAELKNGKMVLENIEVDILLLREADEVVWNNDILPMYQPIYERIKAEKEAAEKAEAERVEKERKEREEFDRKQAEFKAQQEEFQLRQAELLRKEEEAENEKKRIEKERQDRMVEVRVASLTELGFRFNYSAKAYVYSYKEFSVSVYIPQINQWDEQTWDRFLASAKEGVAKREAEKEVEAQKKRDQEIADAKQKAIEEERARIKKQEDDEKERHRLATIEEQERLDKATDSQKWVMFCEGINEIKFPDVKSKKYRTFVSMAKEKIEEIKSLK